MSEVTGRLQAFGTRLAEDGYPSALVEQAVTRMDAMENEIVRQAKRIAELEAKVAAQAEYIMTCNRVNNNLKKELKEMSDE